MKTVTVIGGGASGLIAAITAAEDPENRVVLLERQERVGRKLLATGNGRCNLTNTSASPSSYHGNIPSFAGPALSAFSPEAALEWFRSIGLVCSVQYGGRVYPLSDSASSVLDVLRFSLAASGAELLTGEAVESLARSRSGRFTVFTPQRVIEADAVIAACGGRAGGKLGGTGSGYDLLKSLGHHCTPIYPALVPISTDSEHPRSLKGVRVEAGIRLHKDGKLLAESSGELQFTENGISGPAAFDVSRSAAIHGGDLSIDFLQDCSPEELILLLQRRRKMSPELEVGNVFAGILHSRLGLAVVKSCFVRPSSPISELSDGNILDLAGAAKDFHLRVKGVGGFENAQVTVGGIRCDEFDASTLQSRLVPGLYACGELLDIDGDCGGFNLQWAWSSGRLAGRLGR